MSDSCMPWLNQRARKLASALAFHMLPLALLLMAAGVSWASKYRATVDAGRRRKKQIQQLKSKQGAAKKETKRSSVNGFNSIGLGASPCQRLLVVQPCKRLSDRVIESCSKKCWLACVSRDGGGLYQKPKKGVTTTAGCNAFLLLLLLLLHPPFVGHAEQALELTCLVACQ